MDSFDIIILCAATQRLRESIYNVSGKINFPIKTILRVRHQKYNDSRIVTFNSHSVRFIMACHIHNVGLMDDRQKRISQTPRSADLLARYR